MSQRLMLIDEIRRDAALNSTDSGIIHSAVIPARTFRRAELVSGRLIMRDAMSQRLMLIYKSVETLRLTLRTVESFIPPSSLPIRSSGLLVSGSQTDKHQPQYTTVKTPNHESLCS